MEHDDGVDTLTPFFVRKADYRHVLYQGMRTYQRFDLRRINVLAAGNNHIALAAYSALQTKIADGRSFHCVKAGSGALNCKNHN